MNEFSSWCGSFSEFPSKCRSTFGSLLFASLFRFSGLPQRLFGEEKFGADAARFGRCPCAVDCSLLDVDRSSDAVGLVKMHAEFSSFVTLM